MAGSRHRRASDKKRHRSRSRSRGRDRRHERDRDAETQPGRRAGGGTKSTERSATSGRPAKPTRAETTAGGRRPKPSKGGAGGIGAAAKVAAVAVVELPPTKSSEARLRQLALASMWNKKRAKAAAEKGAALARSEVVLDEATKAAIKSKWSILESDEEPESPPDGQPGDQLEGQPAGQPVGADGPAGLPQSLGCSTQPAAVTGASASAAPRRTRWGGSEATGTALTVAQSSAAAVSLDCVVSHMVTAKDSSAAARPVAVLLDSAAVAAGVRDAGDSEVARIMGAAAGGGEAVTAVAAAGPVVLGPSLPPTGAAAAAVADGAVVAVEAAAAEAGVAAGAGEAVDTRRKSRWAKRTRWAVQDSSTQLVRSGGIQNQHCSCGGPWSLSIWSPVCLPVCLANTAHTIKMHRAPWVHGPVTCAQPLH